MADTKLLLCEYSVIDYDVKLIKEQKEQNQPIVLKGVFQRAGQRNNNGRIYPKTILEREVNNYQQLVRERRAVGELDHPDCVSDDTEILTTTGWKLIKDIPDNEIVITLNPSTNEIQEQKIIRKIVQRYDDALIHIWNKKSLDIQVTPNHRVLLWDRAGTPDFVTASELYSDIENKTNTHCSIKSGGNWIGNDIEEFLLPDFEQGIKADDFVAFLGIWVAEGWIAGAKGGAVHNEDDVCISQYTENTKAEISSLLSKLPFEYREMHNGFHIKSKPLYSYLKQFGNVYTKHLPKEIKSLSPRLLSIMLKWMLKGDGRNRQQYQLTEKTHREQIEITQEYATVSPQLANDVSEIMLKLGYSSSVNHYTQLDRMIEKDRMILSENSQPIYIVYERQATHISLDSRYTNIEKVNYTGNIYCVETPNGTWMMRRNGKMCWTGNSSVVELKNVSHLITELWWDGDDLWGKLEVLNTPSGQILKSLLESNVKIGVSSRGVGSLQDKGEYNLVEEDFLLVCIDIVSDPSTQGAFLMHEAKQVSLQKTLNQLTKRDRLNRILNKING